MSIDCGSFQIVFDHQNWVLKILTNSNPISGWKPLWRESATFKSAADWYASAYSRQVSEAVKDDIAYFWSDAETAAAKTHDLV